MPETGGWYLKSDYPGIFQYVNELPMDDIVAGVDDVTPALANAAKWNVGINKFWVPNTGGYFDRNIAIDNSIDPDGVRTSGSIQDALTGPHTHPGLSNIPTGSHSAASSALTGIIRFLVNTFASGGNVSATADVVTTQNNGTGSGTETRPKNIATHVYRII